MDIDKTKEFILEKSHQAYEREISTLWQRSIFLATFILATFTGLGSLFAKCLESEMSFSTFKFTTIAFFFMSLIGLVLAILWIFMAKASKANQNVCEMRIIAFSKKFNVTCVDCSENIDDASFINETGVTPQALGLVYGKKFKKYMGWQHKNSKNFFKIEGGPFSVSKINILLGFVFFFIYFALNILSLMVIAFVFFGRDLSELETHNSFFVFNKYGYFDYFQHLLKPLSGYIVFSFLVLCLVLVLFVFTKFLNKRLYSYYLDFNNR